MSLSALVAALLLATLPAVGQTHRAPAKPHSVPVKPAGPVTLTPALVEPGSPELIRIHGDYTRLEGSWLGKKIEFFPGVDPLNWYALAGTDVETPVGASQLKITAWNGATAHDLSLPVTIHPARYRTTKLTLPPKFVEPGSEDLKEVEAAQKAKDKAFALAEKSDKPLWSGSFLAPVTALPTDSFGTRRLVNGKQSAIHKGTDFRAPTGTPVLAGNSGRVILAQKLYYEGNCVMVDHGQGLISISMHLSQIDIKPGQAVAKGERLGLSGATGRVTGPHLHWAIRWEGTMLDPAKLLKMNLNNLR
jgi:murein DD-endopeptidase MepM/ murein hydrolase activator NlpD